MKHNILIRFNKEVAYKEMILEIKTLFEGLTEIDGIHKVVLHQNCIDRENRFHLLVQIEMDKEVLSVYDESAIHKKWIKEYAHLVEKKAIFDFED